MFRLLQELLRLIRTAAATGWPYVARLTVLLVVATLVVPITVAQTHDVLSDMTTSCVLSAHA